MPRQKDRPYKAQKRTYLQGTILKLFEHHLQREEETAAAYLRRLVKQDLTERYQMNTSGGIVKVRRN